jgi:hypothetical protein
MSQPSFVPIRDADQVRPSLRLEQPVPWSPDRPAELRSPVAQTGRGFGKPGPDQGYALRVARAFADRVVLADGEDLEDVLVGCALLASRRAGAFGRAPSAPDLKWAMNLWGFLYPSPPEVVAARREWFRSVSHDYVLQRALVDQVPDDSLRLTPDEVAGRRSEWKALVGA